MLVVCVNELSIITQDQYTSKCVFKGAGLPYNEILLKKVCHSDIIDELGEI
jgi:hypothetical protein